MPQKRKKKEKDKKPVTLTAAGLLSFYEDFDAIVTLKPIHIVLLAIAFAAAVLLLHVAAPPLG